MPAELTITSSAGISSVCRISSGEASTPAGSSSRNSYLFAALTSSAAFGLILAWLVSDIDKTPEEIVAFLKMTFSKPFV